MKTLGVNMKKILAIILLPLLLALPIGEASYAFTSSQNCQELPQEIIDSCSCATMSSQGQDDSCCCATSTPTDGKSISLISETRINEFCFDIQFDFFASFEVVKKTDIFGNHNQYLPTNNINSYEFVYFSPPIYQQNCSLRI